MSKVIIVGNGLKIIENERKGTFNLYHQHHAGKVELTAQEMLDLYDWLLTQVSYLEQARDDSQKKEELKRRV
jgi:hypothetical protein